MTTPYIPRLDRRQTLRWIAASSVASALPSWTVGHATSKEDNGRSTEPSSAVGYGTDPDLKNPVVPWPVIMTGEQLKKAALLADLILPGTASAPAPSGLGVQNFINEWVSAPYPEQLRDRGIIFEGLEWLDAESTRRGGRSFSDVTKVVRHQLVNDLASNEPATDFAPYQPFFRRFRFLVVGAYYTTPEGWKDIGYVGNLPLASYPPITHEERTILDAALARLNLV